MLAESRWFVSKTIFKRALKWIVTIIEHEPFMSSSSLEEREFCTMAMYRFLKFKDRKIVFVLCSAVYRNCVRVQWKWKTQLLQTWCSISIDCRRNIRILSLWLRKWFVINLFEKKEFVDWFRLSNIIWHQSLKLYFFFNYYLQGVD